MNNARTDIKSFNEYYYNQIKIIFIILMALSILGNSIDIFNYYGEDRYLPYFNGITIVLLMLSLVLHFRFQVSLSFSFGLGLYSVVVNLLVSLLLSDRSDTYLLFLFRESIFMLLMLVFAGLFIHRIHSIIIFILIVIYYSYIAFNIQPPFLVENLPLLFMVYLALVIVVYFFAEKLHQSIYDIQKQQNIILKNNEKLESGTNELLAVTKELGIKNEKLQEMNVSKDKFFTIISHDLKNPLNALNGFTELLIERIDKLPTGKRNLYLKNIQDSVKKIENLLADLLEWSRSQSNIMKCEPSFFNIGNPIETVCFYLKLSADAKKIQLTVKLKNDPQVYADYDMIFTVLRNLVSNAIKFSYPGQEIIILSEETDNTIKTSIVDQGMGIEQEGFDSLFKIDKSFSTQGTKHETGTGLGLILCKEFIDKNKGVIGVESSPGKGSTFWFSLPKAAK